MQDTIAATPLLRGASELASLETRRICGKVTVPTKKEERQAMKVFSRMLAKVAAANPLATFSYMIDRVSFVIRLAHWLLPVRCPC